MPQCKTAEFAQQAVEAVKFPPHGVRGLAGDRWCNYNLGGDLVSKARLLGLSCSDRLCSG
jgi:2-keto-3-deoxy-L-rhamnonate aldolase RhmA